MKPTNLIESREIQVKNVNTMKEFLQTEFVVEHYQTTNTQIKFHDDGTLEFGNQRLQYTDLVHDAIVANCKIPNSFENDITFEQFNWIFERRKFDKPCAMTLCTSNGVVVGVGPEHYAFGSAKCGVARTLDFVNEMNLGEDSWEFGSATISDAGVKINLFIPGETVEPEVGDILRIGHEISNSETGGTSLKSDLFSLRLACINGMTRRNEQTSVYLSKQGTRSARSKMLAFVREVEKSKTAVVESAKWLYENIVDAPMMDTDLLALHRTIKRRVGPTLDADDVLGIEPKQRIEIHNRVRGRDNREGSQPTDFLAWNIHNAITATARSQRLQLRRALEHIGGVVLSTAQDRMRDDNEFGVSLN